MQFMLKNLMSYGTDTKMELIATGKFRQIHGTRKRIINVQMKLETETVFAKFRRKSPGRGV